MRCEDVIRELATPVEGQDAAALAEHLDICSACAEWSARMTSWDRLWNMTRPVEPPPEAWGAVWNRLERAFDAAPARASDTAEVNIPLQSPHASIRLAPSTVSDESRLVLQPGEVQRGIAPDPFPVETWIRSKSPRQQFLIHASAAAGLIALGLSLFALPAAPRKTPMHEQMTLHGGPIESSIPPPVIGSVDIEEGELVVIRTADPQVSAATSETGIVRYEPEDGVDWFVMFGAIESMEIPVVAGR